MIEITEIFKAMSEPLTEVFTRHKYDEALIQAGCRTTDRGWFDSVGRFMGASSKDACDTMGVIAEPVPAIRYHATSKDESYLLIDMGETALKIKDTWVWGETAESPELTAVRAGDV